MKISTNGVHGWRIVSAIEIRKNIRQNIAAISDSARRMSVQQAAVKMFDEIKHDPQFVGGPRYRYHQLGLLNYVYTSEYFILHYAVDEQRHLIYLRKFVLLND